MSSEPARGKRAIRTSPGPASGQTFIQVVQETKRTPDCTVLELGIRAPLPYHWLREIAYRWDAVVRIHVCRPTGRAPAMLFQLLEICAPRQNRAKICRFIQSNASNGGLTLALMTTERIMVRSVVPMPKLCSVVFQLGAECAKCPFIADRTANSVETSEARWILLISSKTNVQPLLDAVRVSSTKDPTVSRIGRYRSNQSLTRRQEAALMCAMQLGYLEVPRRATLGRIAESLGVSRPTAMETLRRALHNLALEWSTTGSSPPRFA